MSLLPVIATEEFFAQLGITSIVKESPAGKVLGRAVMFDSESQALLLPTGFDHSVYPDQHLLLLIDGVTLDVWKNFDTTRKKSSVVVYIKPEVEHLKDSYFESLLRPVLCNPHYDEDPVINIVVTGRKSQNNPTA
jgi:hypothetical protein